MKILTWLLLVMLGVYVLEKLLLLPRNSNAVKLLQVMSDDPDVNLLFLNLLCQSRAEEEFN